MCISVSPAGSSSKESPFALTFIIPVHVTIICCLNTTVFPSGSLLSTPTPPAPSSSGLYNGLSECLKWNQMLQSHQRIPTVAQNPSFLAWRLVPNGTSSTCISELSSCPPPLHRPPLPPSSSSNCTDLRLNSPCSYPCRGFVWDLPSTWNILTQHFRPATSFYFILILFKYS